MQAFDKDYASPSIDELSSHQAPFPCGRSQIARHLIRPKQSSTKQANHPSFQGDKYDFKYVHM